MAQLAGRHQGPASLARTLRSIGRRRLIIVLALVVLAAGLAGSPSTVRLRPAAASVPFTSKFSANANGAIVAFGNNLMTCPATQSGCAAARAGGATNNNSFTMGMLDVDSDPTTFNSSSSDLTMPAGASVLWAGLYWGARLSAGTGGVAATGGASTTNTAISSMQFKVPGGAYRTITASTAARDQFGPDSSSSYAYQRFADVTDLVKSSGNGTYFGANVVAATGEDRYAGWSIVVAYSAPGLPLRNLTIFDGFTNVSSTSPQTVTVSGFQAPKAGTVDTQLSMVAYEGDLATSGDYAKLNNTQLATAMTPGSNFFNSANEAGGQSVSTRNPADRNMLGFDVKNLGASGTIPNGATSATFTFGSSGDVYFPGVLGMAINLYAPDFTASTKTVVDLSGHSPARPGDTLEYTLTYPNTGQDPAVQAVSTDPLPPNTTYVPGSLRILSGPNAGAKTDAAGDDQGDYDAANRRIRVRLGTGANGTTGGQIDVGATTSYSFRVTLDDASTGTTVTNLANLDYRTGTTDIAATYTTSPVSTPVTNQADVSITKTLAPSTAAVGAPLTATLIVHNAGPGTATGLTVSDPLPDSWVQDSVDAPAGSSCTTTTTVTCTLPDLASGGTATIVLHGHTGSGASVTSMTNVAYVSTSAYDPDQSNNSGSDTVGFVRQADLAVTKSVSPAQAPAGATVSYTLTVTNRGPTDATNVSLDDTVADASQISLTDVTSTSGGVTCNPPTTTLACAIPTLAAGASATVTVSGLLASDLTAGDTVANRARVSSDVADPDPTNNTATATVTIGAPEADVRLTKTGPATATAGTSISYTLEATNFGPSDASGVVVTDTLPASITVTGASSDRGACTITGRTVTCPVGTLRAAADGSGAGASGTITITGTLAADTPPGPLTNTASVTAATDDPAPANNSATATTQVQRSFDLGVTKTSDKLSLPGVARDITYTITVSNHGPSVATGIQVSDLVPLPLSFVSVSVPDGTCDTSQIGTPQPGDSAHGLMTCTLPGPLQPEATSTITLTVHASGDLSGGPDLTETVSVTAPGDDQSKLDDNSATWTLSGQPHPDLALFKTGPADAVAGTTGTYTLRVTNHSPGDNVIAEPSTIVDTLPAGVTFVSSGSACSVPDPSAPQTVQCQVPQIPDEGEATVTFDVRFGAGLADGTRVTNSAEVIPGPGNPDPAPDNNVSQATTTIHAVADVAVTSYTITAVTAETGPNTLREFSVTLTNNGPSVARDVTWILALPDLDMYVDIPPGCAGVNGELECTVDGNDLAPGQSVTVTFYGAVVGYADPGTYLSTVRAATTTTESDLANNLATTPVVVGAAHTELQVTKSPVTSVTNTDKHPAFVAGGDFHYDIGVSVDGPGGSGVADARGVVVTDTMPAGFVATSASSSQGTCTVAAGGGSITCTIGTVAAWPGDPTPIDIDVRGTVSDSLRGEAIPNTATATSTTLDATGTPATASASTDVDVIEQSDLRMIKVADSTVAHAGGTIGFTLTAANAGPSSASDVTVHDTLPQGLTFVPDATSGCSVVGGTPQTGQQVECAIGTLAVGDSVSVRVVASISPYDAPHTITNTANVTPVAEDPNPGDDSDTVDVAIDRLTDVALAASVSTTTPAAGTDITFTGDVSNNGPSAAWNTSGDTVFPPGFVPVSVDVPGQSCTWDQPAPADPTAVAWTDHSWVLHCVPADPSVPFPPGASTHNVVVMHIPGDTPTGSYTASSKTQTDTPESTLANNRTSDTVSVTRVSDLSAVKRLVSAAPLVAGQNATWQITIHNAGPSAADGVVVSDTVPGDMTYVSATDASGGACQTPSATDNSVVVRCGPGSVPVGGTSTVTITMRIADAAAGLHLCNTALVGSESLDPNAADNQTTACNPAVAAPPDTAVPTAPAATAGPSQAPAHAKHCRKPRHHRGAARRLRCAKAGHHRHRHHKRHPTPSYPTTFTSGLRAGALALTGGLAAGESPVPSARLRPATERGVRLNP